MSTPATDLAQSDQTDTTQDNTQDTVKKNDANSSKPLKVGVLETQDDSPHPELEASLLQASRMLLREFGIRKSLAAIRETVDIRHTSYGPREAVNVLSNFGFKSSFGAIASKELQPAFAPFIAINKSSKAVFVQSLSDTSVTVVKETNEKITTQQLSRAEFDDWYSGYLILSKRLTGVELEEQQGHWFFSAFRKSKWIYFQVLVAAMMSNFLGLTTAIFTMTVYDRIIPNGALESLLAISIGVVIALLFDFVIKGLRAKFIDTASQKADLEISRRLFDRILSLSPSQQNKQTGALAGTVKEFETLREFFNSSTLVILIDLPFVFFFIYVIYLIAGPLAVVPGVAVPLVILVGLVIQPILKRVTQSTVQNGLNKQSVLVETLNGLETIKATGSGRLMRRRYIDALNSQSNSGSRIRAIGAFVVNFAASVQQYAQVALIFYGVFLIIDGTITQGALIGAVILSGRTMGPLSSLANTMSRMNGAITSYRNLDTLIGSKSAGVTNSPISRPVFQGEIEFKNVSFAYVDAPNPTIDRLNLKITAGQRVAIIGKMGSGKSTLLKLIAGMVEPSEGAILIDGIDVRQIDKSDIRQNIGVMLQDAWLFSGSVRENIQLGYEQYSDSHLLDVCRVAGVDDFVGSNPQGYDMKIKESGVGLSGGQKQSINLARSLLHNPSVLLLDEPTSAMDQSSERQTIERLKSFTKGKTFITITHRNPILSIVDRVIILEGGKVIADQTPEQLGIKKVAADV